MDSCMEPHHPLKCAQALQAVDKTGGRRRQLPFSHMWRMMPRAYVKRMIHADLRERQWQELEKMHPHLLCQQEALRALWPHPCHHPSKTPQGMRHLCWIWFSHWAQILLPNLSPIPPEQQGHGVLSDLALRNRPGRKWGHSGALKTWRRVRFWKTYFSYDWSTCYTFPWEVLVCLPCLHWV